MALTVASLAVALRLTDGGTVPEPLNSELTRLLLSSTSLVESYGSENVPTAVEDEATARIANYLYSMPDAPMSSKYADVVRNSGADILLKPYKSVGVSTIE